MGLKQTLIEYFKWKFKIFNGLFISVWGRPVKAKDVHLHTYVSANSKVGIIIQGGLWTQYDFTLETIKLYKKHYPSAVIILSTWADSPSQQITKLKEIGIELILNEKPYPILGNSNLQLISTQAGIQRAEELGCEYICKTRTDQRMYATGIFPYLIKMIDKFTVPSHSGLRGRIVALGSNTFRNRLYDVNDMWLFGYTNDIKRYWSCSPEFPWNEKEMNGHARNEFPIESYFCIHFLKSLGIKPKWTIEDSVSVYAKYFIVIDLQSLDLYFIKRSKEYFNKYYNDKISNVEFSFRDWMSLQ